MCNWWTGKQTITASNQVKKNLTSIIWICQCWDIWPIRARWQNIIWLHFRHASRLWPSFPFLSCSFGLLHSRIFSTPSSWLCSSKAPGPPVPNFCSWVTRKSLFFYHVLGTLDFTGSKQWAPFTFPWRIALIMYVCISFPTDGSGSRLWLCILLYCRGIFMEDILCMHYIPS